MIGKIRDTAIGLWPVLKTYVPKPGQIILLIVAFLIGLIWSYAFDPIQFYNADPRTLGQGWQDEYVGLINDRYTLETQNAPASAEFDEAIISRLAAVDAPAEIVNRLGYAELGGLAAQADARAPLPPAEPSLIASIRPFIVGPIVLAVLFVIGSLLYGFYINPMVVEPIRKRLRGARGSDAAGAAKIHEIQAARQMAQQLAQQDAAAAAAGGVAYGPPVVRHVSIYTPSRAYDDSFSIEDAAKDDEFLGECGAVISETIGVGEPEKVTAIEVWLFDKEDFVRTLTAVFISEHAYNDPAIRSKLETKGELVVAKPGAIAILETSSLRLQARIVDVVYGTGPLPPNSYFDKLTLELQAWRQDGASAPVASAPVAAAPVNSPAPATQFAPPPSTPAAPTFAPPPMPSQPTPTYGGSGFAPMQPPPSQLPPAQPPRTIDDDPFGGTGDFTPVN